MTDAYDWTCPERAALIERWTPLLIARFPELEQLTAAARHAFAAPMSFVSLLQPGGLQVVAPQSPAELQVPPRHAFCRRVVEQRSVYVVMNAAADPQYAENPYVRRPPYKRFYAGAPIHLPGGHVLGAFCVVDVEPRFKFTAEDEAALSRYARLAERLVFENGDAGR